MGRLVIIHFRIIAKYYHKQFSLEEQIVDYIRKDNVAGYSVNI